MPTIGKPDIAGQNSRYNDISIRPKSVSKNQEKNKGDKLNEMAGVRQESQYVDKAKQNTLGKDEFIKLLTHQLQNQDPMNPMDQKKFAADLAQFAQLEQMSNMAKSVDKLNQNAPTESKFYAASFLGKEVMTRGSSINFKGEGTKADLNFFLNEPAEQVSIRIFDMQGNIVGEINKDRLGKGNQSIEWNGQTLDNSVAGKGGYAFQVKAYNDKYEAVEAVTKANGVVSGVFFKDGEAVLVVDGKNIFLRDVDSFKLPDEKKTSGIAQQQQAYKNAAAKAVPYNSATSIYD